MNFHCNGIPLSLIRCSLINLSIVLTCIFPNSGCSKVKTLVPVSGTILVKGKPAAGAVVLFHPVDPAGGEPASGVTEDDGTFTLVTSREGGVAAGKYRVSVTWPDESKRDSKPKGMTDSPEDPPDLLQGRYSSLQTTTLEAVIEDDTKELKPFDLDPGK